MDETLREAVLYLLRENREARAAYPMETGEVDRLLEVLDA